MESLSDSISSAVSIQDWMKLAIESDSESGICYIQKKVNLAWLLTKHLRKVVASAANVNFDLLEGHVTAANVLIFLDDRPAAAPGRAPAILDVKFKFELVPGVNLLVSSLERAGGTITAADPTPRPRAVCAALGKMLMEVFSKGTSTSTEVSHNGTGNVDHYLQRARQRARNHDDAAAIVPPEGKRQATMPAANGSASTTASNLLMELGLPLSLCRLVGDLLDAESGDPCPDNALASIEEALWDLACMRSNPESFLFDRKCPQRALDDSCLFGSTDDHGLFGREEEMSVLLTVRDKVSAHVCMEDNVHRSVSMQGSNFLCEMALLGGYAGSGKSRVLEALVRSCKKKQWFVLRGKFDKQTPPHMVILKCFDDFFGKMLGQTNDDDIHSSVANAFNQAYGQIFSTLDDDGFHQLCDLVPNFAKMSPYLSNSSENRDQGEISSMDKVGTAEKRFFNLIGVLLSSFCSVGHPVLLALDDLQWCHSWFTDGMAHFIVNYMPDTSCIGRDTSRRGMLIVGTYRSNEVKEDDDFFEGINVIRQSKEAHVTMLPIGELRKTDITKLISAKLCLPWRYTHQLAAIVHNKTRGNPFCVIQFLRSIIQNKMVEFSVKSRRWIWDCDVVDMVMISEGVVELLTSTFSQLPSEMMKTVKIISCLGFQVEESTINAFDLRKEVLPYEMLSQLQLAVDEGIMEKAGPIYQFTHDIIHQTIYELIAPSSRKLLHMTIGKDLLQSAANNPTIHLLAVDQINMYCKDGNISQEERSQYAQSNALAAKLAISSSSFAQARSYIDAGMHLLDTQHWQTQYSLSLDLFEMSASVSCMHGDTITMSSCLDEILSHAKSFDDSLKASGLLAKLLASSSKFEEARTNCLIILSSLGVEIPEVISLPIVLNELSEIQTTLRSITRERMKLLPPMTDKNMLNAMKFLNMLCMYSIISKPLMIPYASCRMIRLTLEYGICDDSIVGLATVGYSIFLFTDEIQLAEQLGQVSHSLVEESPKRHALRSRLCNELYATLRMIKEPWQSAVALYPGLSDSAMLVGDIESAMVCRWSYCAGGFFVGVLSLSALSNGVIRCIKEVAKYQQNTVLYSTFALSHCISLMSGRSTNYAGIKSFDELNDIAEKTNNIFLAWQISNCQICNHFWMREYIQVAELSEKHSEKHLSSQQKRILQVYRAFWQGVAYLSLARDTKQAKWRAMGEKSVAIMSHLEANMCKWNFENKCKLLQAELAYLNGDLESAEEAYWASIKSACKHKFLHERALARELFGIFCVENHMVDKGLDQLRVALDEYKQWGAIGKADEVQLSIDILDSSSVGMYKSM